VSTSAIQKFDGYNRFLSNFYPAVVNFEGAEYPSVEHAYQAAKTVDVSKRTAFQYPGLSSKDAKAMGRRLVMREGWDEMKLGVMEQLLREKFKHADLRQKLLATAPAELVEGNWWGDTWWGMCHGVGENHLGRLLMKIRDEAASGR